MTREALFTVRGMDCAACAVRIENKLKSLKGVRAAAVDFGTERLRLEYTPEAIDPDYRSLTEIIDRCASLLAE